MRRGTTFAARMRWLWSLDAFLVVWTLAWIAVAAYTAYEVQALRSLSDTVVKTGVAVDTTGKALQGVANLPLVGGQLRTLADQVRAAGQSAEASGASTRDSVDTLSMLLGIAIGLIPTVPVVVLYLPARLARRRERLEVGRAVQRWGAEPGLEDYLARRALANIPYHELREAGGEPSGGLTRATRRRLAEAELERLGLDVRLPRERERERPSALRTG